MNRQYTVLLEIGEFRNRGDFMMMETAWEQVRSRVPGARIAVSTRLYDEQPGWCRSHGLIPLQPLPRHVGRRLRLRLGRFVSRVLLPQTSFLLPDEIDLVLYAVGYRYSDHFARYYTKRLVVAEEAYLASFTKKGRKIVLMPQALGPFETAPAREKMLGIYRYADLVFARERESFDNLMGIVPGARNVFLSPDFTCLCEPRPDGVRLPSGEYVVLIPNRRMVTHTSGTAASAYIPFFRKVIAALLERGERVVLLNHQEGDDEGLIADLDAAFGNRLTTVSGLTGSGCKDVIARSKLVISSRFHGAVSGLVTGVPTFCTGWSHKYAELMREHGRPDNVIDILNPENAVSLIADALDHPDRYRSAPGCTEAIRAKVEEMWVRISALVQDNVI